MGRHCKRGTVYTADYTPRLTLLRGLDPPVSFNISEAELETRASAPRMCPTML